MISQGDFLGFRSLSIAVFTTLHHLIFPSFAAFLLSDRSLKMPKNEVSFEHPNESEPDEILSLLAACQDEDSEKR